MNPAMVPIFIIQLIGAMGYGIVFPLMPFYTTQYGGTPLINGLLVASYALCAFFAGPFLGAQSDRQGRRPWLLFSLLGTVLGFVIIAVGGSLWVLFLGRMIDGISGGNVVIAQAYINDVSKPEERTQNFGIMGAAFGVGFVLGPLLSLLLVPYGLALPMWAAAGLSLLGTAVAYFKLPESIKPGARNAPARSVRGQFAAIGEVFTRIELRPLLLIFAAFVLSGFLVISAMAQFAQLRFNIPASQAGLPAMVWGLLNIVFQTFLLRPVVGRIGERAMLPIGLATMIVPGAGMFLATQFWHLLATMPFLALGMTLLRPGLNGLLTTLTGPHEAGKVLGVAGSMDSVAQMIAPLVGGFLMQTVVPGAPGLLAALFAVLGLFLYGRSRRGLPERAGFGPPRQPPDRA